MILFIHNDFHQVTWCVIHKINTIIYIYIYWKNFVEIKAQPFFLIQKYHFARMYSYCLPHSHFNIDLISQEKKHFFVIFHFLKGLLISIGLLLFQWNEKPIISFLGNFQTNNFNIIF
jgi:hypothetical protein